MQIEAKNNDKQRTDKWHAERLGKFSCSQFHRLVGEPKSKADKEAGNLNEKVKMILTRNIQIGALIMNQLQKVFIVK